MRSIALAFALAALSGCGTVVNLQDSRQVYGGVERDAILVTALPVGAVTCVARGIGLSKPEECEEIPPALATLIGAVCILDLPISAVGDTLTLPVTVRAALCKMFTTGAPRPESANLDQQTGEQPLREPATQPR
jgi:uncharacterized protein YceK